MPSKLWRTARNQAARFELLPSRSGTHDTLTPEQIVRQAREYLDDYCDVGGLTPDVLADARMLEIGPGNNLAVPLLFLARGASQVVCIDRFRAAPNPQQSQAAYALIYEQMSPSEQARCADVWQDGKLLVSSHLSDRLTYLWDCSIEDSIARLGREQFDIVVSRSVLEHVYSVGDAISSTWNLLRDGGHSVHKVDLRSHEEGHERHPLDFLTHSPTWWRWMTSHTGEPNRLRKSEYLRLLKECGFEVQRFEVTHSIRREELDEIRRRLAAPFRALPDEDLLDTGVFFHAIKPVHSAIQRLEKSAARSFVTAGGGGDRVSREC